MGIKSTHFTVEARKWLNLVSRRIRSSSNVSDVTYHQTLVVACILDQERFPREQGDEIIACNMPFDPLRVKGASSGAGRKEGMIQRRRTIRTEAIQDVLGSLVQAHVEHQADLEAEKKKRRLWDKLLVKMWKRMKKLLRTLSPLLMLPKVSKEDA
ncbi:hypothetical protein HAX54_040581 [Datura stramonium]|uniref:Uncharacterized protein n=1 Tax=Datura stramonium TaxID=4076 RepID=A0ABS8SKL8_DATST|nr:hypothetical protein [Datura stramonium]